MSLSRDRLPIQCTYLDEKSELLFTIVYYEWRQLNVLLISRLAHDFLTRHISILGGHGFD